MIKAENLLEAVDATDIAYNEQVHFEMCLKHIYEAGPVVFFQIFCNEYSFRMFHL